MRDGDNYVFRALTGGFINGVVAGVFIPLGLIFGQLLVVLPLLLFGASNINSPGAFMALLIVSFGYGLISGLGVAMAALVFWAMIKVMHEEISRLEYLIIVASWQVANFLGATIVLHTFTKSWMASLLALAMVGGLWWGSQKLRLHNEESSIAQMQEEGEEFRREMAERRLRKNVRMRRH